MSATNSTTNYELSQFIGTDKPAWLSDYNGDMAKIDAGIHTAQASATTADGKADTNATNIGNLANLNTSAKTDIVSSVNEVYNTATVANGTAQASATTANSAKTEADALSSYLSITNTGTINVTVTGGTIASGYSDGMKYALNADGTLGKIYGRLRFTKTTTGATTVTMPIPNLNVTSSFTINGAFYYYCTSGSGITVINSRDIVVNTNGTVTFDIPSAIAVNDSVTIWFPPCLYFFTDFGDVVNPND